MTFNEARDAMRRSGITLKRVDGEYRVNFVGGKEATAYYTDDLTDAVQTGRIMAATKQSTQSN